jgi:hypothetical protein
MKLAIPEGYTLPEDLVDGDVFEELVSFRLEGGELVPTSLAGIAIAEEDEAVADEELAMDEEMDMSLGGISERIAGV